MSAAEQWEALSVRASKWANPHESDTDEDTEASEIDDYCHGPLSHGSGALMRLAGRAALLALFARLMAIVSRPT